VPFIVSVSVSHFRSLTSTNMSWDAYVSLLYTADTGKGKDTVTAGAIWGQDGTKWGEKDITCSADEIKGIMAGAKDEKKFQGSGITVGGVKYMYTSTVEEVFLGKKGTVSLMVKLSTKGVIIVLLKDGASPGNNTSVAFVVKDLVSKGY